MAKKVVATLKTKGEKNYAKVIRAIKNEKTGAYSFKEMIVTADHGNCEVMWDSTAQSVHTAHTTNPVPCLLVGADESATVRDGTLADLAPSLLSLLTLEVPDEMTGTSLISHKVT